MDTARELLGGIIADSAVRLLGAVLIERDEDWLPVAGISTWLSIGNGNRLENRARQNHFHKLPYASPEV